jgi:hypothetical protein
MPNVTLKVGPMSVITDTDKVAHKYAIKAPEQMTKAATDNIQTSKELKAIQSKKARTYTFSATLNEVVFGTRNGQPSVTCRLSAALSTPNQFRTDGKEDIVSGNISGNATTIGGTTDRDVADCVAGAVEATINKSVVTGIKDHIDKNP